MKVISFWTILTNCIHFKNAKLFCLFVSYSCSRHCCCSILRELNEGNYLKITDTAPRWPCILAFIFSTLKCYINRNAGTAWCCIMMVCIMHRVVCVWWQQHSCPTFSPLLSWVKLWDWEIYCCGHWMFHILQPFLANSPEQSTMFMPSLLSS